MAKALTDRERRIRLELIDMAAQGIRTHGSSGYYTQAEIDYAVKQLERIAKFLCVKN